MDNLPPLPTAALQASTSQPLRFRVARALGLDAPAIKQANGNSLAPEAAKDALTAVVSFTGAQPADEVQVTWAGNGAAGSTQSAWIAVGSVPREIPLNQGVVAFNLGQTVQVSYGVRRNGVALGTSQTLVLNVQAFQTGPGSPLPTPQLTEAVGDVLDIDAIVDQGHVTLARWPLIALNQRFWLTLEGRKEDGSVHNLTQANGVLVNAHNVENGLTNRQVPAAYFKELGHGTNVRLVIKVAFDGVNDASKAVSFPLRTYTVKAIQLGYEDFSGVPKDQQYADNVWSSPLPSGLYIRPSARGGSESLRARIVAPSGAHELTGNFHSPDPATDATVLEFAVLWDNTPLEHPLSMRIQFSADNPDVTIMASAYWDDSSTSEFLLGTAEEVLLTIPSGVHAREHSGPNHQRHFNFDINASTSPLMTINIKSLEWVRS